MIFNIPLLLRVFASKLWGLISLYFKLLIDFDTNSKNPFSHASSWISYHIWFFCSFKKNLNAVSPPLALNVFIQSFSIIVFWKSSAILKSSLNIIASGFSFIIFAANEWIVITSKPFVDSIPFSSKIFFILPLKLFAALFIYVRIKILPFSFLFSSNSFATKLVTINVFPAPGTAGTAIVPHS